MDLQGIKSGDLSVADLLKDFYEVPDYQREFVWKTKDVERLLEDVHSEYTTSPADNPREYFIGTIVTHHRKGDGVYELIDGQQRVTTLYLFLIAVRDVLTDLGAELQGISSQLVDWATDSAGNEAELHRVELQYDDSQDVVTLLASPRSEVSIDSLPTETLSASNLVQAYRDCRAFLLEDLRGDSSEIRKFYAYLTNNVKLIRIRTESVDRALWIFETINARGQSLDAMDLLKNLLFRYAKSDEFERLKQRWKALVDLLFEAGERPLGFIRYYLLANHAVERMQADAIYSWLTDQDNPDAPDYKSNPIAFTNTLLAAARAYVNFAQGKLEDGAECRYLSNMWHLSHTARQHLILLLAARGLPRDSFVQLAQEIESLYFVFILTRQSANIFEKDFVEWARQLRIMTTDEELQQFLNETLRPRRHALRREFEFAVRNLLEDNLPKYRLKYVLGKLAQYLDEIAYGPTELKTYAERRVDIEHILSVSALDADRELFGDEAPYVIHRLANLTLLERTHNAVVSNKTFAEKQPVYAQSNIILTKGLGGGVAVGRDTAINAALSYVGEYTSWGPKSFQGREDRLVELANRVWDVDSEP